MKTTKMNLANMQGKLSRAEMKNIMAGSGGSPVCSDGCKQDSDCETNNSCPKCLPGRGPVNYGCWFSS